MDAALADGVLLRELAVAVERDDVGIAGKSEGADGERLARDIDAGDRLAWEIADAARVPGGGAALLAVGRAGETKG